MAKTWSSEDPILTKCLTFRPSQTIQYNINKSTEKIIVDGGKGYGDIQEDNGRKGSWGELL